MEKVRIQDDLFTHVNGEWLEKAVIPADRPRTGGFDNLDVGVETLLIKDFNEMCDTNTYPNDYLKTACAIFKAVKDTKKRNRDGARPVFKKLAKIEKLKDISAFNRNLKDLVVEGYPLPLTIDVDVDMKDTRRRVVMVQGPSVILPDTTYYKPEMEQQKQMMLGLWTNMVKEVLKSTKLDASLHDAYIADALAFDAKLATLVKSSEEWSDYPAIYNPMKTSKVNSLVKPIKFKKVLVDLFGEAPEMIIVAEPRFFKAFKEVFNDDTFNQYKHWAYIRTILGGCALLSEKLRDLGTSFSRALSGIAAVAPVEKHAYRLASQLLSEPVGLYYGEKYFGEEAKKDVVEMVHEIIDTYKVRITKNDFLSEATKEKAILKLSKIEVKMGYPDKVNPFYDKLSYDETKSLYENVSEGRKIRRLDQFAKLNEEVDRSEWVMPGHMVNACYNPFTNDITFPAAILQAPFYSVKQSRSTNLGGIGAVIGHEISHAFDNNGAKCDERGNLNNWWTKEDTKKFNQRTKAMVKQFDGIELPWGKVNGAFIVSENIADNGGMGVTLEIMSHTPNANYEDYFINWAKVWCIKAKPEYQQLLLRVDVHAPAYLRANMQPRNFAEWYKTFDVKKTDKMYIPEAKRITIW